MSRWNRLARIVVYGSGITAVSAIAGCDSAAIQTEVSRLKQEIRRVRTDSGESDDTIKVLAVFLASKPPNRTLEAMNDPKTLYISTFRFVCVVIRSDRVTIQYRGQRREYSLRPRLYSLFSYMYGGRDLLAEHFLGEHYWTNERLVVADTSLNTIEAEAIADSLLSPGKPSLIAKYGQYFEADYEAWLKRAREPEPTGTTDPIQRER